MNVCGLKLPLSLDPNLTEALASSANMTASSTSLFNSLPLTKKMNPNNNNASSINGNKLNNREGNYFDSNNAGNTPSNASKKSKYS